MKQRLFQCFVLVTVIFVSALILLQIFSTKKSVQSGLDYDPYADYVDYSVVLRLDKQVDIYKTLGKMLEDLICGNAAVEQVAGFCEGVNIFSRADMIDSAYALLYGENTELSAALKNLTSLTTTVNEDVLTKLSAGELQELADICTSLSECCNRNNVGQSLAYFLYIQDQNSDAYTASLQEACDLSRKFILITIYPR